MNTASNRFMYIIAFLLITAAAFSRLLPHPLNFTPVAALALFGGVYFEKRFAFLLPLSAMFVSDYFIGFYDSIGWVYAGFILVGLVGMWVKERKSFTTVVFGSVAGSVTFFILTNFGVWMSGFNMYPKTVEGLAACYIAAIPFFRNTFAGDLFYAAVLFGSYELASIAVKRYTAAAAVRIK